jgi:hypothetical protein
MNSVVLWVTRQQAPPSPRHQASVVRRRAAPNVDAGKQAAHRAKDQACQYHARYFSTGAIGTGVCPEMGLGSY